MKVATPSKIGLLCLLSVFLLGTTAAQTRRTTTANLNQTTNNNIGITETVESSIPSTGCDTTNGTRFNLEPRLNAQAQNSESVAFLLDGVSPGVDLVVGAGNEAAVTVNTRFGNDVHDAYYVHRRGANCNADFEGTLPFAGLGALFPTVVADPARGAFFLADLALSDGQPAMQVARTTAATLLSPTDCPSGTQQVGANPNCWPVGTIAVFMQPENQTAMLFPHMSVDPRISGTGAGDVYLAAEILNLQKFPAIDTVQIIACTNQTLSCGQPVVVSGTDQFAGRPWVQVRPDGLITISYLTFTQAPPSPSEIKFVTCQPQGAPKPPVCSAPHLVAKESFKVASFAPGDDDFDVQLYPKHVNRMESGGTFITFLVYDRCRSIISPPLFGTAPVCSKIDLVIGESTNGGATWSTFTPVESAVGHQFMGTISNDVSTGITNIAYYSTQNDPFLQRPQIFVSQIPAGSTTAGTAKAISAAATDLNVGIQDFVVRNGIQDVGLQIGLASAGTGTTGQSKLYVHYTWNNVFGISNGTKQPDQNNTLIPFSY